MRVQPQCIFSVKFYLDQSVVSPLEETPQIWQYFQLNYILWWLPLEA